MGARLSLQRVFFGGLGGLESVGFVFYTVKGLGSVGLFKVHRMNCSGPGFRMGGLGFGVPGPQQCVE